MKITSTKWEERSASEGDTVRITWAKWYGAIIGTERSIGVLLKFIGDRMVIDIGGRKKILPSGSSVEVLNVA